MTDLPHTEHTVSPDDMAQFMMRALGGRDAALAAASEPVDPRKGEAEAGFWSDVAALLRLETQSDEEA